MPLRKYPGWRESTVSGMSSAHLNQESNPFYRGILKMLSNESIFPRKGSVRAEISPQSCKFYSFSHKIIPGIWRNFGLEGVPVCAKFEAEKGSAKTHLAKSTTHSESFFSVKTCKACENNERLFFFFFNEQKTALKVEAWRGLVPE